MLLLTRFECAFRVSTDGERGLIWTFVTRGAVYSSPALANGILYVGSEDGNLYAIEATAGTLLWPQNLKYPVYSSPSTDGKIVVVGNDDLRAFDARTGTLLWTAGIPSSIVSTAALVKGRIALVGADDGYLYAVDRGVIRWRAGTLGGILSSPATDGRLVYVGSYATNGIIDLSSPAVADGTVYIGSTDGYLYAFR